MKKIVLLISLLLFAAVNAQDAFVSVDNTPLLNDEGAQFAQLKITVPVTILEEADGQARVRVDGAVAADELGEAAVVYSNSQDEIVVAESVDPGQVQLGDEEAGWAEAGLEGWVDAAALTDDREPLFTQAASTYQRYCSRCHVGYAGPVEQLIERLKPADWPEVAHRMAMGTGISNADLSLVVHWLQHESQQHHN